MQTPPAPARISLGSGYPSEPVVDHIMAQPGVQRVPSPKLSLFIRRALVPADLCAALIERIDARRRPSTIADANGDPTFRTSETCDLDPADPVEQAQPRANQFHCPSWVISSIIPLTAVSIG